MNREVTIQKIKILQELEKRNAKKTILDFTNYTKHDYIANWHHKVYAEKIDKFMSGEIKNLMVFMPPQRGKSEISTRRVPAKLLGDNPNIKIGIVAYNHTIAAKFNREIQRIIDSEEYKKLYPETNLSGANVRTTGMYLKNSDEFEIVEKEGSLVSVGIGGSLTSRKIDVLIMDDLYKDAQSAWSPTIRENVEEWYLTVGKTRLHKDSQQLLVFTRWHEDDLAGHLLRTEPDDWEVILFEAIKTDIPRENDPREVGEQLWAAQHTMESLIKIRENNPIIFESLFQQNPTPKEGLLLPISDLKRFKMEQIKSTTPDGIISTTDTADEGADSLCQLVGYIYGDDVYIPDVIFTQEPIEITEPMCASQIDLHNVKRAYFESNNGGKGFARKVKELIRGRTTVRWHHTSKNKHTKIIMSSGIIKQNFYFLEDDEQSKMYQRYFYELTHYPTNGKSKHDDAPDATSMLENKISSKAGIGFLR